MTSYSTAIFFLRICLCLIVALEVFVGISSGSPWAWGSAAFCAMMGLTGNWDIR
jgi:hypothetical protein